MNPRKYNRTKKERLKISAYGKFWVLQSQTKTTLKFIVEDNTLAEWRAKVGFSQRRAAIVLGVSQSFLSKIEERRKPLPAALSAKIAKFSPAS